MCDRAKLYQFYKSNKYYLLFLLTIICLILVVISFAIALIFAGVGCWGNGGKCDDEYRITCNNDTMCTNLEEPCEIGTVMINKNGICDTNIDYNLYLLHIGHIFARICIGFIILYCGMIPLNVYCICKHGLYYYQAIDDDTRVDHKMEVSQITQDLSPRGLYYSDSIENNDGTPIEITTTHPPEEL